VISLTYASAIDDPARFKSSKIVGAFFGMTPTRYQSGETDVSGRISRIGDAAVRAVLYEGAHVILTTPVEGCTALKSWVMRIKESAAASRTIRAFTPVCNGLCSATRR
jgi:transposase